MSQTNEHIIIFSDRSIVVPSTLQRIAVLSDHNVETVTFDCPRYWDGHDMSTPDWNVHINYMLANGMLGSIKAEKVTVDVADNSIMHFDWTITKETTQVVGPMMFMVCIRNLDSDGKEIRHWNTEPNEDMRVSDGLEPEEEVLLPEADIITYMRQIFEIVYEMYGEGLEALKGVVEATPDTVPMRDASGYLYAATPDETASDDAVATTRYVNTKDDAIRSTCEWEDAAIRGEFAAADNVVRGEFAAADDEVRDEFKASDATLSGAIVTLSDTLENNYNTLNEADELLLENHNILKATVTGTGGHGERITALETAIGISESGESGETTLIDRVSTLETGLDTLESTLEVADAGLAASIATNSNAISDLDDTIGLSAATEGTLLYRVSTLETTVSEHGTSIATNSSDIVTLDGTAQTHDGRISALETAIGISESGESSGTTLTDRVGTLETKVTDDGTHSGRIGALEGKFIIEGSVPSSLADGVFCFVCDS